MKKLSYVSISMDETLKEKLKYLAEQEQRSLSSQVKLARTVKTAVLANFFNAHISRLGLKTAFCNIPFFLFK